MSAAPTSRDHGLIWIGAGTALLGLLMAAGATQIGGDAGYGGVGPAFLAWMVSAVLALLGILLARAGLRGVTIEAPDFPPRWKAIAWVSAGLLLNALLIERVGFIASCALLFALAARGFRIGADQTPSHASFGQDLLVGVSIAAPVFWLFTKVLGLTLPALLAGGWI